MAEIGTKLRETRIRRKIDVTVVEEQTKIRAKYLRALENEEWDLLPGPTYVRSFLRTYAEFLGLDGQLLVDEFRMEVETGHGKETYAGGYGEPLLQERIRLAPSSPRMGRGGAIALAAAGLVAFLAILGLTSGDSKPDRSPTKAHRADRAPVKTPVKHKKAAPPSRIIRVSVTATGPVWVCLIDAKGRRLINAQVLAAGARRGPFKGKRFRITFGNGSAVLRLGSRRFQVPQVSKPIGYALERGHRRVLSEKQRPTCA